MSLLWWCSPLVTPWEASVARAMAAVLLFSVGSDLVLWLLLLLLLPALWQILLSGTVGVKMLPPFDNDVWKIQLYVLGICILWIRYCKPRLLNFLPSTTFGTLDGYCYRDNDRYKLEAHCWKFIQTISVLQYNISLLPGIS